jgi:hypothetical protein
MYRYDLDSLSREGPAQASPRPSNQNIDNSAGRVLWEVGLVLASTLTFAVAVNEAIILFHAA